MRGLLLVFVMLGTIGCQDTFEAPPLPDLYKTPRDLGINLPSDDLAVSNADLGRRDFAVGKDLSTISDHDLAEVDAN